MDPEHARTHTPMKRKFYQHGLRYARHLVESELEVVAQQEQFAAAELPLMRLLTKLNQNITDMNDA